MTDPLAGDGRVMALDYGRRRIGVAVSDPTRTIASPHGVIERPKSAKGPADLPEALIALIERMEPRALVVGIPLAMDGTAGEMALEARAFGAALTERTGRPVLEWDERLSSAHAERELRALDLPRNKRREKGRTDTMAATLMLTGFLRSRTWTPE